MSRPALDVYRIVHTGNGAAAMSVSQVQKCLYNSCAQRNAPRPEQKPDISAERYDLTDAERKAVDTLDIGIALHNGHASSDNQRPVPVDVLPAG
jgi:hypothetical protein